MDNRRFDRIRICDLMLNCIVGVHEHERTAPRPVCVNVTLYIAAAARRDDIGCTIDYALLQQAIQAQVAASAFNLIESLAEMIAKIALSDPRVAVATVCVGKPGALQGARTVEVEITRAQEGL